VSPDPTHDRDHYAAFYADKLWNLLPEVYRAEDAAADSPPSGVSPEDRAGPLRELLRRVGAQAAVVRRSLDRAWADQSPETCDAWATAYLGDLLATNVLPYLDDAARRRDVGKTIHYRRRKGTLGGLEELAADITGWDVKLVEFFRRLARARHNFDPHFGDPPELLLAQALIGPTTGTPAGGTADLRRPAGAVRSRTAFDEFAHTPDFRRGRGVTGWHGIPKLGVFVWRLNSYAVQLGTPVEFTGKPGCFTFDPSGRQVPLFAAGRRDADAFDRWVSPAEWQLPGPISRELFRAARADLYPAAVAVRTRSGIDWPPAAPDTEATVRPAIGTFTLTTPLADAADVGVSYRYGFAADIGAGPFDRRAYGTAFTPALALAVPTVAGVPATGEVELADGRTFTAAAAVTATRLAVRAANFTRGVLRLDADWEFTGTGENATLTLDGLYVCGGNAVVLKGHFGRVLVRCCTFDPGTWTAANKYPEAADGVPLAPTRLVVDGTVSELVVERSILGPVAAGGGVASVRATA
jgi:hypothetical protein